MKLSKKFLCCFWVAIMFCVIVSGGCGGGGGGDLSGGNDTTNETPNNPNDDNEYSFENILGSWVASNGSGTATGSDGTFDLSMISVEATFVQTTSGNVGHGVGTTRTIMASASARWDAYQNGVFIRSIPLEYGYQTIKIKQIDKNTWRYTFPSSGSKITAKFTSETTASVTEKGTFILGSYEYKYVATYTMRKK